MVRWRNGTGASPQWRRLDASPFQGEFALADGSPNADKYTAPGAPKPQAPRQSLPPAPAAPSKTEELKAAVAAIVPQSEAPPAHGEKILSNPRRVNYTKGGEALHYWVVQTDYAEYVTQDYDLVQALEATRSRGLRIRPQYESRATQGGTKKVIIEYKEM
jgi:hypothetical protein